MKERLIGLIIRDRSRVLPLLIGLVLALSGRLATALLGYEMTPEDANQITLVTTLLFGWMIDGWAADKNARGGAAVQAAVQTIDSRIEVDQYIGHKTVKAVQAAVQEIKDIERTDHHPQ